MALAPDIKAFVLTYMLRDNFQPFSFLLLSMPLLRQGGRRDPRPASLQTMSLESPCVRTGDAALSGDIDWVGRHDAASEGGKSKNIIR